MNKHSLKLTLVALSIASASLLSGCTMGPDYKKADIALPEQWLSPIAQRSEQQAEWQNWWQQYDDPALNALVERALQDNLDLQLQLSRIEQARAELGFERANRWPTLSAQAAVSREQQPAAAMVAFPGGNTVNSQYSVTGMLSYEIDLWGRLSRQREAAAALLEQSILAADAVRLALTADVISYYFSVQALQQQLLTLQANVDSLSQSLTIEQRRYDMGASDQLTLQRSKAALASATAMLPDLQETLQLSQSALAILVGYSPQELLSKVSFGQRSLADLSIPDKLPAHTPSELLLNRPDVRAAEANLMAANARIGIAQAARFPSFNLNAVGGSSALSSSDLFSSGAEHWSVTGNLAAPLFDFGRLARQVESAEAQREQANVAYQQTVLAAVGDAQDAISLLHISATRAQAYTEQHQALTESYRLAQLQYNAGAISSFELLANQRELLNAEISVTDAKRQHLLAYTTLFKAFGGSWQTEN